ncbi:MAG TPA: hypothetical protein VEK82_04855 [Stellaceae bacterium]|nr:hypothetical protein [Stellaceae bacterium]
MTAWPQVASVILVQLALISPNASGTGDCGTATDAYQAAVAKVTNALRTYEQCIQASHGKDKCSAEMQQLDDAHDDYEDAVGEFTQACP